MTEYTLKPCRACGSECMLEVFGPNNVLWICSQHKFYGGGCPSETAYLTESAWNTRACNSHDALIAENERLREALERSREGWLNAIELGLIPARHRNTARILADEAGKVLSAAKEPQQ